jgi:DNA-3-methyladenine glycosylase
VDPRSSLSGHAADVAPRLLGATLASRVGGERVVLRITEVEAYGGVAEDPGSHAFRRRTPRNATMFGRAGLAYVYFTYGMHWCFCIVTGAEDQASAVLVRAGEVVSGVATARSRRQSAASDRDLARGPARLTAALGITAAQDGVDLLGRGAALRLTLPADPGREYSVSARTGVSGAGASTPWRFYLPGEPTVSPYRRAAR